jgi:hypothetical protein
VPTEPSTNTNTVTPIRSAAINTEAMSISLFLVDDLFRRVIEKTPRCFIKAHKYII